MIRQKRPIDMIFCLPGNNFSSKFLQSWSRLLIHCMKNGINCHILEMYSSNVYHVRECFVANQVLSTTKKIKPFEGRQYDYVLWIDSDQVFSPDQLEALLARDVDIVGAAIKVDQNNQYAFGWLSEDFVKKGELERMTVADMNGREALIEVDFLGLAFTLVKRGVFESLDFPWFNPLPYSANSVAKDQIGIMGEDLSLCHRLKEKGYKLYIDPLVQVGHEKSHII